MSIYKGNKLIAGVPNKPDRPDWAKAVLLDHRGRLYSNGYTAPSNGIIVGWFRFTNHIAVLDLQVNGITVARSSMINNSVNSEGNVQCPVNKGESIKLECTQGVIHYSNIDAALYFVPYKA